MNRGTVPIVARLMALQRPSHVAAGGVRVIAEVSDPNPMTALMRELNETILARSLRIESSTGAGLTLELAGRRVLRLTEATGVVGAESCLAASALEDEQKDALITLMQAIAVPLHELRVTTFPSNETGEGVSVGLPVALLADLLLVELNEGELADTAPVRTVEPPPVRASASRPAVQTPSDPAPETDKVPASAVVSAGLNLDRFARAMGPTLSAWLIRGGEDDGRFDGPDEMVSHMRGFLDDEAEAVLRQLDLVSNRKGAPVCSILGAAIIEGHSVLCARSGESLLLGLVDGDATLPLIAAWADARA